MNKTINLKPYLPILLLVVLVLFMPTEVAFANVIHKFFYGIVTTVFGWLVFVGAMVLNYGINYFVVDFGEQYITSGVGVTVETMWATFRDLFNLTFIFGLVYIGFKMILRSDDSNTRKWLINLVIAALLVNFSLFITKFVIDFSNILAVEIMNMSSAGPNAIFPLDGNGDVDLASSMANQTGVVTVNAPDATQEAAEKVAADSFTFVFGTMFLYIVTAFVFFSAGILLIIRGVVLYVLMIVSPFLFLGMVLPFFRNLSSRLWGTLFSRAFMAPIYVAILYIAMSVAGNLIGGATKFDEALAPGANVVSDTANSFGPFIIVIALLLMSLTIAQKLGVEGASTMIKMGNNMQRYGRRQIARGAGGMGSRAVARRAEKVQRGYDRMGQSRGGRFARTAVSAATLGAFSNKGIKAAQNIKVAGSETLAEQRKRKQTIQQQSNEQVREDERLERSQSADSGVQASGVRRMSPEELSRLDEAQLNKVAPHLTDQQLGSLESQGLKTVAEVNQLKEARNAATLQQFDSTFDHAGASVAELDEAMGGLKRTIQSMSTERLEGMGADQLTNERVAMNLTDRQIDGLRDSGKLSPEQIEEIGDARSAGNATYARTGLPPGAPTYTDPAVSAAATTNRQRFMNNPKQAGNLSADTLAEPEMAEFLSPQVVEERMRNGNVTNDQLKKLRESIEKEISRGSLDEVDRKSKVWKQWSERSTYGAQLGISDSALSGGTTT